MSIEASMPLDPVRPFASLNFLLCGLSALVSPMMMFLDILEPAVSVRTLLMKELRLEEELGPTV